MPHKAPYKALKAHVRCITLKAHKAYRSDLKEGLTIKGLGTPMMKIIRPTPT